MDPRNLIHIHTNISWLANARLVNAELIQLCVSSTRIKHAKERERECAAAVPKSSPARGFCAPFPAQVLLVHRVKEWRGCRLA
jgi:hypothetical protein